MKHAAISTDRTRFSENTFCTISCSFRPRYLPHRMIEPPTSTVLIVVISMPSGLYSPTALMASMPTKFVAK